MKASLQQALADQLQALADDELILAHRNSEWTGHGPILEEDIAFTNIALDEMGHAALWYAHLAELQGEASAALTDRLIFFRDPTEYRNVQLVELPNGDWAFSMLRQFLFDTAEMVRLERLRESGYLPLSQIAAKLIPEERYHLRYSSARVRRLGLGTQESNARMQRAAEAQFPYALQLFEPLAGEQELVQQGWIPAASELRDDWRARVEALLLEAGLALPDSPRCVAADRSQHSEHLVELLTEMQSVARAEAGSAW